MLSNVDFNEEILNHHILYSKNYMSRIDRVSHSKHGTNQICGDEIKVNLDIQNNLINDINFEGVCCPIAKASASLMTEELKGKSLVEVDRLFFKAQEIISLEIGSDDLFSILMIQLKAMAIQQKRVLSVYFYRGKQCMRLFRRTK